jgi:diguanylate cyclase
MYFDCDNFKAFNDQTEGGHRQGDAVLKAVSKALMEVSSPKVTSYRFGGDEFTVIIIADTEEEAKVRAKQVFASINGITVPDIVSNAPLTVKISAGFAIRTDELGVPDELTAKADSLLYEAKKAGKGQIVVG